MLARPAHSDNMAHRGDFQTASPYATVGTQQQSDIGCRLRADRSPLLFRLESKNLAQLSRAGVGKDCPINIDGWNRAIAVIPLLDTQCSILVRFDVNFSIKDIMLIQEPLGDAAIASP